MDVSILQAGLLRGGSTAKADDQPAHLRDRAAGEKFASVVVEDKADVSAGRAESITRSRKTADEGGTYDAGFPNGDQFGTAPPGRIDLRTIVRVLGGGGLDVERGNRYCRGHDEPSRGDVESWSLTAAMSGSESGISKFCSGVHDTAQRAE